MMFLHTLSWPGSAVRRQVLYVMKIEVLCEGWVPYQDPDNAVDTLQKFLQLCVSEERTAA
jgi:hypothetical protein